MAGRLSVGIAPSFCHADPVNSQWREISSIMAKPAVILVGADKGGVGKTTVARTLLDYFTAHQVPIRAFDTEAPRGTLKRFHPDITEVVDVTQVADQMKIFDTLANASADVTVIDVRAGLLSSTLRALNEIGFLDSAKKGQITFAVFHILGPSIASLDEIAETAKTVGDASYFLVKNFINNTTFFEWDPATYSSYFNRIKGAQDITVAKLNEMACEQVEVAGVPFVGFVANKGPGGGAANYSFVLRGYVRHWLGNVWSEYDRVKLLDLISPKEDGSMRQAAS
jgi:MinD-like ATPase involved in chromosome partitioning or flagellar assembly